MYNDNKKCYNCRYIERSGSQLPCSKCMGHDSEFPMFEKQQPKEVEQ